MKAIQISKYGKPENLTLVELPIPKIKPNELLVQSRAASVNPYDCMARSGEMWFMEGFRFPKILGCELAGVVVDKGSAVGQFRVGQRVIVFTGRRGAYAEYVAVSELNVTALPDAVSFSEGAALPVAGSTAYDALHLLSNVKPGQRVLVYGAYGAVGSFAVQLAKYAGAFVVGVCSTANLASVKAIGADEVIDYTTTDFKKMSTSFDIVFDTPTALKYREVKRLLSASGTFVATLPSPVNMFNQLFSTKKGKKVKTIFANPTREKIDFLATLVSEGKLKVIVDREYLMEQIGEAHRYSETKRAKGKLVVSFN